MQALSASGVLLCESGRCLVRAGRTLFLSMSYALSPASPAGNKHISVALSKLPPAPQSVATSGQICLTFFWVFGQPHTLPGHWPHVSSKKVHSA